MKLSELEVGKTYEGPYGDAYTVMEILGRHTERQGSVYRKEFKQAVRVRLSQYSSDTAGRVIEARSLKRPYELREQETQDARQAHEKTKDDFATLCELLAAFDVRSWFDDNPNVGKPGQLHLSAPAIRELLMALQARQRTSALAEHLGD